MLPNFEINFSKQAKKNVDFRRVTQNKDATEHDAIYMRYMRRNSL